MRLGISPRTSDYPRRRAVLPLMMAGLLGWNIWATAAWLGARPALADTVSCATLDSEVAELRRSLDQKDGALKALSARLRTMAQGNIRQVEQALTGTGLRVDSLIRRDGPDSAGEGGPFIPAGPTLHEDVERWDRLSRAVKILPLAAPLADYRISSVFGIRRDPINHRRAMHLGLDLRAPLRSPVLATAPGRVVFAGRKGGYGRMVEIDHGLGVHTRYGHLAAIHVHPGQMLRRGERVGLLGSSGRSTGAHLHYEVLVDGKARNPKPFLNAGVRLAKQP